MAKQPQKSELRIEPLKQGRATFRIIGTMPLYFNAMSAKAKRDLLLGGRKKTAADKAEIKHDPYDEYRDSLYCQDKGPTLLYLPAPCVKGAMATAALETSGVTKTSVNRLVFLPQSKINVYGKPYLKTDMVRQAGINATPDVRTRGYLPQWCAEFNVAFIQPSLSVKSVAALVQNGGLLCGLGDFRQEKGKGSFGTYRVVDGKTQDDEWDEIVTMGRDVQRQAYETPEPFSEEDREVLEWYDERYLEKHGTPRLVEAAE